MSCGWHSVVVGATDASDTGRAQRTFVALRVAVAVTVAVLWAGYMLALLGRCDAFGGTCDGTRPALLDDDVAGGAFVGTAVAAFALWWLRHPSVRQASVGVGAALAAAVVVAFLARGIAHG